MSYDLDLLDLSDDLDVLDFVDSDGNLVDSEEDLERYLSRLQERSLGGRRGISLKKNLIIALDTGARARARP